jgi:hypothetical protein
MPSGSKKITDAVMCHSQPSTPKPKIIAGSTVAASAAVRR